MIGRGVRLTAIASALPGLLDWDSLWNLDFREEEVLHRMAHVARLQREKDIAQAVRLGMTTENDYTSRMAAIKSEIAGVALCQTREEKIAQNRSELRQLFGVKVKKNG